MQDILSEPSRRAGLISLGGEIAQDMNSGQPVYLEGSCTGCTLWAGEDLFLQDVKGALCKEEMVQDDYWKPSGTLVSQKEKLKYPPIPETGEA